MKRLVASLVRRLGVPVEAAVATAKAEAPEQHAGGIGGDDAVHGRTDLRHRDEADLTHEKRLAASRGGDRLGHVSGHIDAIAGIVVGRDHVDFGHLE